MGYGKFKFVIWCDDVDGRPADHTAGLEIIKEMEAKYGWTYVVCGYENCPETGRRHLDGYYEMKTQRKLAGEVKKFTKMICRGFGDLQTARGTAAENYDYSTKEGNDMYESGQAVVNGESCDLTGYKRKIDAGEMTADDVCMVDPECYHQYGRTLTKCEDLHLRNQFRKEMTRGLWIWGATGAGKSHAAFTGWDPATHYLWKLNDKSWQDGYTQQPIVVINDFRGEISYNEMLNLVDKFPFTVSRRSREPMPFTSRIVIVTSSLPPALVFKQRQEEDSLDQLMRRVQVVEKTREQDIIIDWL
jgi:hypothetical protein